MRSARTWMILACALVVGASLLLLSGPLMQNEASCFSTGGEGLLLARSYLEGQGTRCGVLPEDEARGGAILISFPASGMLPSAELARIRQRLRRGTPLLLLYSTSGRSFQQGLVFDRLGLRERKVEEENSLNPIRWWREKSTPLSLEGEGLRTPVLISPARLGLSPESGDKILLEDKRTGVIFGLSRKVGSGRLLVLPSELLANQRLLRGGNLEFLSKLRASLPDALLFDERIHGFASAAPEESTGTPMADVLLLHGLLIYLLALLALGRRMGPAWPLAAPAVNAVSGLLLRSGAAHRKKGHHAEAASAMLERAAEYHRWPEIPSALADEARLLRKNDLLEFARKVARRQPGRFR